MNEYAVVYELDSVVFSVIVRAATAALAREAIPEAALKVSVKFLRGAGFSCRIRGAQR